MLRGNATAKLGMIKLVHSDILFSLAASSLHLNIVLNRIILRNTFNPLIRISPYATSFKLIIKDSNFQQCNANFCEFSGTYIDEVPNINPSIDRRIYTKGYRLHIFDSLFINCTSTEDKVNFPRHLYNGGAIGFSSLDELIVERTRTINCMSYHSGGAIYLESNDNCTIENCLIQNCHTVEYKDPTYFGGGIYLADNENTLVKLCNISGCYSNSALALYISNEKNLEIAYSVIDRNGINDNIAGITIYSKSSTCSIEHVLFYETLFPITSDPNVAQCDLSIVECPSIILDECCFVHKHQRQYKYYGMYLENSMQMESAISIINTTTTTGEEDFVTKEGSISLNLQEIFYNETNDECHILYQTPSTPPEPSESVPDQVEELSKWVWLGPVIAIIVIFIVLIILLVCYFYRCYCFEKMGAINKERGFISPEQENYLEESEL